MPENASHVETAAESNLRYWQERATAAEAELARQRGAAMMANARVRELEAKLAGDQQARDRHAGELWREAEERA